MSEEKNVNDNTEMPEGSATPIEPTPEVSNQVPNAPAGEKPASDLNISDLVTLRSIIDVATERGAFKAAEMEAVGKAYNK